MTKNERGKNMNKEHNKAAGKSDIKTIVNMIIPVEVEKGKKGEFILDQNGYETIANIPEVLEKNGYIEIPTGDFIKDPKTGERKMVTLKKKEKNSEERETK